MKQSVVFIRLGCVALLAGCSRPSAPPAVNPDMAKSYNEVSRALSPGQVDTDEAVKTLSQARTKDPDNAMNAYLFAVALAQRKDWEGVSRELKAGNQAPHCVYYVDDSPFRVMPGLATLRDLARKCAAAAPSLGVEKGAPLLTDLRVMAKKVAGTEPAGVVPIRLACAVREIADRALLALYTKSERKADADHAKRLLEADKAWMEKARAEADSLDAKVDLSSLVRKHFTAEEWQESDNGRHATPALKVKLDAVKDDVDAVARPFAQKYLKSMPD